MKLINILKSQLEKIKPSEKELKEIGEKADELAQNLKKEIKKEGIKADVFIGGSLAKKTILKKEKQDIDVFVRFAGKYKDEEISGLLEKILKNMKARKIHGSRDYFQLKMGKINFEIIPVIMISNPKEARNVTDLSYFHVNYVKNKLEKNKKLQDEILLAKSFCHAQKCYGAESYINGFSGYALELLVIYYGSFARFLKEALNSKLPIIIDPAKYYKNKEEIMAGINEAKLSSPIIFIDPTYKERNVLAALSYETFSKFKEACKKFLKKPDEKFFEGQEINQKKYNFIIKARTSKQAGDIAGSKLKKFFNFLSSDIEKYFSVLGREFEYDLKKEAEFYFKIKKKKEIIFPGPIITAIENVIKFKEKHKKVFVRNGRIYAREKSPEIKKFISDFKLKNRKIMLEMGIACLI